MSDIIPLNCVQTVNHLGSFSPARQPAVYLHITRDGVPSFPLGAVAGVAAIRQAPEHRPIYRMALRLAKLQRGKTT